MRGSRKLSSDQVNTARTRSAPQVVHSKAQSLLELWSTTPKGNSILKQGHQLLTVYWEMGNLWIIRDWKTKMMNELVIFEHLHKISLTNPKAMGLIGHSDEMNTSVLAHQ